jgi:hypothetical protein
MSYAVTRTGVGAFPVGPAKRPGMASYGITSARAPVTKRGGSAVGSGSRMRVTGASGLGVVPIAIAAQVISGMIHQSSDPTNLADNNVLYQRALQGNTQALVNLATVSGQAGQAAGIPNAGMISVTSTPIWRSGIGATLLGGWGGAVSQADAAQKYQAAVAALGGGTPVGVTQPSSGVVPQIITQPGVNYQLPSTTVAAPTSLQASLLGGGLAAPLLLGLGIFVLAKTVFANRPKAAA